MKPLVITHGDGALCICDNCTLILSNKTDHSDHTKKEDTFSVEDSNGKIILTIDANGKKLFDELVFALEVAYLEPLNILKDIATSMHNIEQTIMDYMR